MSDPTKNKNTSTPHNAEEEKKARLNDEVGQGLKPDPETLHTTDPQEHMKGPISSSVQSVKKEVEKGDEESRREAEKKKEENM